MRTILVPVDFTATSENAAIFAADWAGKYGYSRIIIFKTFYDSLFGNVLMAADYIVVDQEHLNAQREEAIQKLEDLRTRVMEKVAPGIAVSIVVSELPLLRGILTVLRDEVAPELIILGSDDYSFSNGSLLSDNIIRIAKASPVKVLIVPSAYTYKPVKNILVPCDIKSVTSLGKLDKINVNFKAQDAQLLLLHVNKSGLPEATETDIKAWEDNVHTYLQDFQHAVYYASNKDVITGILSFITSHPVELIIALPGKHSFLYYLTNKSISEGIYKNARQPVLILK